MELQLLKDVDKYRELLKRFAPSEEFNKIFRNANLDIAIDNIKAISKSEFCTDINAANELIELLEKQKL